MEYKKILFPVATITLLFVATTAYSGEECNYYVDSEIGNNTYSGKAASYDEVDGPLKSMYGVTNKSSEFTGGDHICFRKGQRFYYVNNGALRSSGDVVNGPIVYTSYGLETETKPVLSVSRETNPDENGTIWNPLNDGTNRYQYNYGRCYVSGLWEDGVALTRSIDANLSDGGDWYFPAYSVYADCISTDPALRNIIYRPKDQRGVSDYSLAGRSIMMSNNSYVFALNHAATGESLSYITFDGLAFEYAGSAIAGSAKGVSTETGEALSVHHITVQNSTFNHVVDGVQFNSRTLNNIVHENHHISVINNRFDDIRFAASFMADANTNTGGTAAERHLNIDIIGNVVRDVSLNGAYAIAYNNTSPDIEVFRFQNPWDLNIIGNDVRHGIKETDGITITLNTGMPAALNSAGVVIWHQTDPQQTIERINILNNRFDDLGRGISFGSGVAPLMKDVYIANNIVTNSIMGFRLNSGPIDTVNHPVIIYHNTFINNGDSINLFSNGSEYQLKNNISAWPKNSHISVAQSTGYDFAQFNHNLYVDDAEGAGLFYYARTNSSLNFTEWQNQTNRDPNSLVALDAGFSGGNLQSIPDDNPDNGTPQAPVISGAPYQLIATSPAINKGIDLGITTDFFGAPRIATPDIGADEFEDSDLDSIVDQFDNCPLIANSDQADQDGDGIGDVCDNDRDGDGDPNASDCGPDNSNIYHGAPEIRHNGVDEDCNGYDLTIDVVSAKYSSKNGGSLNIEATSSYGVSANLKINGYAGTQTYKTKNALWVLKASQVGPMPGTVTVSGDEGSETIPLQ